jgi:hypothetical protein
MAGFDNTFWFCYRRSLALLLSKLISIEMVGHVIDLRMSCRIDEEALLHKWYYHNIRRAFVLR